MLFGGHFAERLEPVGNMGDPMLHCPFFHSCGYSVGSFHVEGDALVNALKEGFEDLWVEIFFHFPPVENEISVVVGNFLAGIVHAHRSLDK